MSTKTIDDAVSDAAHQEAEAAKAATEAAKAETAHHASEAAEAATAAAAAAQALAETTAAETIKESKEDLAWLHQHATETGNSLKELRENQAKLAESLPAMFRAEREATVSKLAELLTPPKSTPKETVLEVNPELESAQEDGKKAGGKNSPKSKDPKRTRSWT